MRQCMVQTLKPIWKHLHNQPTQTERAFDIWYLCSWCVNRLPNEHPPKPKHNPPSPRIGPGDAPKRNGTAVISVTLVSSFEPGLCNGKTETHQCRFCCNPCLHGSVHFQPAFAPPGKLAIQNMVSKGLRPLVQHVCVDFLLEKCKPSPTSLLSGGQMKFVPFETLYLVASATCFSFVLSLRLFWTQLSFPRRMGEFQSPPNFKYAV